MSETEGAARESRHPRSAELYERACRVIPGGVSSPVRAFRAVGGTPLFIARAAGAQVFDADGRSYLDFVGSWGPLIAGHAHPVVVAAVTEALARGTTFGAPCAGEVELAERIVASYPAIEQVRFVSSGTEAVMSAIRVARAVTGRDLIVKFAGCYHGHADHLLVAAGSGLATFGRPSSAGVPEAFTACTRVLPLDDEAAAEALVRARRPAHRRGHHRAGAGQPRPAAAAARVPRRAAPPDARARRAADLRRGHLRLPPRPRRGGGADRHRARHGDLRQGDRRRHAGRRLRRRARRHGAPRPARRHLPGGHAVGQPGGHGLRARHPRPDAARLRLAAPRGAAARSSSAW